MHEACCRPLLLSFFLPSSLPHLGKQQRVTPLQFVGRKTCNNRCQVRAQATVSSLWLSTGKKKELCFIRNRSSFAVCLDGLIIFSLIPHQPLYVPFQCSTVQRLSLKKNFKKEGGTKIKKKSNQIKKKLVFDCQLTNY